MMSRSKALAAVIVTAFAFALCAPGLASAQARRTDPSLAELATLDAGEARTSRLVEGARREGEVMVYHSIQGEDIGPVFEAFTRKYGVKVKTWRSSSENLLQRVVQEAKAGRHEVDLIENNSPEMEALHREKLLQRVKSPALADLMPQAIPAHGEWVGSTVDVFVQAYNTGKVRKEDLPASYQDLLHPRWKGQLAIEAEDHAWFATLLAALGEERGLKLFNDIAATNGLLVRKGHTLLANLVASGEVPLGLTVYNYRPIQLKRRGAPIDWFVLPPAIGQLRAVGVLSRAPHPHAAVLLHEFVLAEGQAILAKRDFIPTSARVESPGGKAPDRLVDPVQTLDLQQRWIKLYEDTITKRAKP